MSKVNHSTVKTITEILKDSDDVLISMIHPISSKVDSQNLLNDIKRHFDKNKGKDITIVVMSR